jgi:hypothetical protein
MRSLVQISVSQYVAGRFGARPRLKRQLTEIPLSPYVAKRLIAGLATLGSFPSGNETRKSLALLLCDMARYESEACWLIDRMTSGLYASWPGPGEMRACFCARFRPRDGVERRSSVYPEGMPPERQALSPVEHAARVRVNRRVVVPHRGNLRLNEASRPSSFAYVSSEIRVQP